MRKKQEIRKGIAILRMKGDMQELEQKSANKIAE